MLALFTGESSMGYIRGEMYHLKVWLSQKWIWIKDKGEEGEPCPYESINAFLNNWKPLVTEESG